MPKKYKNKYRIESIRLKKWDYRNNGAYFITICTANRKHFFGEIVVLETLKTMKLSEIGELAQTFWEEIPNHFPSVELGNFVIMPNHVHGILIINNNTAQSLDCNDDDAIKNESLTNNESLQCNDFTDGDNHFFSDISPKTGSVSTIIRSYKSIVSKNAHILNKNFEWHPKFHDHIIRNSISFERIQNYIENNPSNWKEDKFYSA